MLHPDIDSDAVTVVTQNNLQKVNPLTPQSGLQILMGTQGVIECEFTGL